MSVIIKTLKNKKGAVIIDVMIAVIFFAIFSLSVYKLIFTGGTTTVLEDIDTANEITEFMNSITEELKIHITCTGGACTVPGTFSAESSSGKFEVKTADVSASADANDGTITVTVSIKEKKSDGTTSEKKNFTFSY